MVVGAQLMIHPEQIRWKAEVLNSDDEIFDGQTSCGHIVIKCWTDIHTVSDVWGPLILIHKDS